MKCPIIKRCGGCFYPQDQYQEELKEKTLFIEKEIKKTKLKIDVKPTVASPLVNGYRNKAIVAFNQKYEYGLYEEHSQDIIPYKHCLLHEDIMDEILQYIQSYLRKYRVSIYCSVSAGRFRRLGYFLNKEPSLRRMTPKMASTKMPLLILDVPAVRSVKMIGTSVMSKPYFQALNFISI